MEAGTLEERHFTTQRNNNESKYEYEEATRPRPSSHIPKALAHSTILPWHQMLQIVHNVIVTPLDMHLLHVVANINTKMSRSRHTFKSVRTASTGTNVGGTSAQMHPPAGSCMSWRCPFQSSEGWANDKT